MNKYHMLIQNYLHGFYVFPSLCIKHFSIIDSKTHFLIICESYSPSLFIYKYILTKYFPNQT